MWWGKLTNLGPLFIYPFVGVFNISAAWFWGKVSYAKHERNVVREALLFWTYCESLQISCNPGESREAWTDFRTPQSAETPDRSFGFIRTRWRNPTSRAQERKIYTYTHSHSYTGFLRVQNIFFAWADITSTLHEVLTFQSSDSFPLHKRFWNDQYPSAAVGFSPFFLYSKVLECTILAGMMCTC